MSVKNNSLVPTIDLAAHQPRLIETDRFPFAFLSSVAERESWRKEVYRPIYHIHKWWAKRLGSVFRGIVLGCVLPDDLDLEDAYYRAHRFNISVFDPFMGSGTTVGEAVKLGCRAYGRDINPVSLIMVDASLQAYSDRQVKDAFRTLEKTIGKQIRSFYSRPLDTGEVVDVLYYFWVKIVPCPSCGHEQELFKSRIFSKHAYSKKYPKSRSVCPGCHAINEVRCDDEKARCPSCRTEYNPQEGAVARSGVTCDSCGALFSLIEAARLLDGPPKHKMYAKIILHQNGVKDYLPIDAADEAAYGAMEGMLEKLWDHIPKERLQTGYNTRQALNYNYVYWHQMFNARQLVSLALLVDAIKKIEPPELRKLFACLLSGTLEFNNMFASFKGEGTGAVRHMFSHHILKPELTPLEANVWGTPKSSGSFSTLFRSRILRALEYKKNPFELKLVLDSSKQNGEKVFNINQPLNRRIAHSFKDLSGNEAVYLSLGDSSQTDIPAGSIDLVITDPPFFDNVHYSELADFFFVWLKEILRPGYGTALFSTRSEKEVQNGDPDEFSRRLKTVFVECHRVLKEGGLLAFTYHHSRLEGWTTLYKAVREAGFSIVRIQPVKSEMSVAVPIQQSSTPINYDLIIVCRKQDVTAAPQSIEENVVLKKAICKTHHAVSTLRSSMMKVSLGDIKNMLMGYVLAELSQANDVSRELRIIEHLDLESATTIKEQFLIAEPHIHENPKIPTISERTPEKQVLP